jgi:hypothetical protein
MERCRNIYRNPAIETILLAAVVVQFITGIRLLIRREAKLSAEKIQVYSGLRRAHSCRAHRCLSLA